MNYHLVFNLRFPPHYWWVLYWQALRSPIFVGVEIQLQQILFSSICVLPSSKDFCSLLLLQECYFYYIITGQQWLKGHAICLYLQSPTQLSPPKSTPFPCSISLICLSSPFPFFMVPASTHLSGTIILSPQWKKQKSSWLIPPDTG